MTISNEKISQFYDYLISEEKSAKTVEKYVRDIVEFAKWLESREFNRQDRGKTKRHDKDGIHTFTAMRTVKTVYRYA